MTFDDYLKSLGYVWKSDDEGGPSGWGSMQEGDDGMEWKWLQDDGELNLRDKFNLSQQQALVAQDPRYADIFGAGLGDPNTSVQDIASVITQDGQVAPLVSPNLTPYLQGNELQTIDPGGVFTDYGITGLDISDPTSVQNYNDAAKLWQDTIAAQQASRNTPFTGGDWLANLAGSVMTGAIMGPALGLGGPLAEASLISGGPVLDIGGFLSGLGGAESGVNAGGLDGPLGDAANPNNILNQMETVAAAPVAAAAAPAAAPAPAPAPTPAPPGAAGAVASVLDPTSQPDYADLGMELGDINPETGGPSGSGFQVPNTGSILDNIINSAGSAFTNSALGKIPRLSLIHI